MHRIIFLSLVGASALAQAASTPKEQDMLGNMWVLKLKDQEKCIGAKGDNSTDLAVADCNGDKGQMWKMDSRTKRQWVNALTGTCLTVSNLKLNADQDNKAALQECSKATNNYQRFPPPPGEFVNYYVDACIGPCKNNPGDVCSFNAADTDWCVIGDTLKNEKVSYAKYCSLDKAQGMWKIANTTECSKPCGCGVKDYTFECKADEGGFDMACCNLDDIPPSSGQCNYIPCDAEPSDFYVLRSTEGQKCITQKDGSALSLDECSGDDTQLWLPTMGMWVNRKTQQCLTVPEYYKADGNLATATDCLDHGFPGAAYQMFTKNLLNVEKAQVCVGPGSDSKVEATRDADESARSWCAAGGVDRPPMNKRMQEVSFCDTPGSEEKCGGKPTTKPSTSTTTPTTSATPTTTPAESIPPATTAAPAETTPATSEPAATTPAQPDIPTEAATTPAESIPVATEPITFPIAPETSAAFPPSTNPTDFVSFPVSGSETGGALPTGGFDTNLPLGSESAADPFATPAGSDSASQGGVLTDNPFPSAPPTNAASVAPSSSSDAFAFPSDFGFLTESSSVPAPTAAPTAPLRPSST